MRLSSPLGWLSDAIELRRLRRRFPCAHRAWSRASGKLRPESDAEYLARLRSLAREREQLRNATIQQARQPHVPVTDVSAAATKQSPLTRDGTGGDGRPVSKTASHARQIRPTRGYSRPRPGHV
jgi:hypothetical protein